VAAHAIAQHYFSQPLTDIHEVHSKPQAITTMWAREAKTASDAMLHVNIVFNGVAGAEPVAPLGLVYHSPAATGAEGAGASLSPAERVARALEPGHAPSVLFDIGAALRQWRSSSDVASASLAHAWLALLVRKRLARRVDLQELEGFLGYPTRGLIDLVHLAVPRLYAAAMIPETSWSGCVVGAHRALQYDARDEKTNVLLATCAPYLRRGNKRAAARELDAAVTQAHLAEQFARETAVLAAVSVSDRDDPCVAVDPAVVDRQDCKAWVTAVARVDEVHPSVNFGPFQSMVTSVITALSRSSGDTALAVVVVLIAPLGIAMVSLGRAMQGKRRNKGRYDV
jgi:hypothetical protein